VLKQRIITALCLIPFVLLLILFSPFWLFAITAGLLLIAAAWEWSHVAQIKFAFIFSISETSHKIIYCSILLGIAIGSYFIPITIIFYSALIWWIIAAIIIVNFPKGKIFWKQHTSLRMLIGMIILIPFVDGLLYVKLQSNGGIWLLLILLLVWVADTSAYFIGKRFGHNKLLPEVSPKKTREGLCGGIGASIIVIIIFGFFTKNPVFLNIGFLMGLFFSIIFSVIGDLTESAVKRFSGIKDSSHILPGHGGILDRIDSLTAALPIFTLTLWLFL